MLISFTIKSLNADIIDYKIRLASFNACIIDYEININPDKNPNWLERGMFGL